MDKDITGKSIFSNKRVIAFIVFAVLLTVYAFPQGLISRYYGVNISFDKLIFSAIVIGAFVANKLFTMRISKAQLLFVAFAIIFSILCKDPRCLLFCYLPALEDLLPFKDKIMRVLKKTDILYICLAFTVFYTILYAGLGIVNQDRFAFSAIGEINQSGLAIFCLAVMLMIKNKKIGYTVMAFGLLTISRSYYLAVMLYGLSKVGFVKKLLSKIKHWWFFRYWFLTVVTSILLVGIGFFFIQQNAIGNVYWGDDADTRLFQLLDYSNLFRFVTNIALLMIFLRTPSALLTGLSDSAYFYESSVSYAELGIPFKTVNPHNLFFSHLRMYGLFALAETWYIDRIMRKIVNEKTVIVFLIMVAYSVILGAGLYSYWIFLAVFAMACESNLALEE